MADDGRTADFDKWDLTEDLTIEGADKPLLVLSLCHAWNPAAMFVARELQALKIARELDFCDVRVVNAGRATDEADTHDIPLHVTPLLMFLWKGKPLTVRRPGVTDSKHFVGSLNKEHLLELIHHASDCGRAGKSVVQCDF